MFDITKSGVVGYSYKVQIRTTDERRRKMAIDREALNARLREITNKAKAQQDSIMEEAYKVNKILYKEIEENLAKANARYDEVSKAVYLMYEALIKDEASK